MYDHEQLPPRQEFAVQPIEIYFSGTERRQMRLAIERVVDDYTVSEAMESALETVTMENPPEFDKEHFVAGFQAFNRFAVRLPLVTYSEILHSKVEVNDARYTPGCRDTDCPELEIGPVHLETGRAVVVFSGITFTSSESGLSVPTPDNDDDHGTFKAFGFIYDPSQQEINHQAMVAPIIGDDREYPVQLKLVTALSNILIKDNDGH